MSWMCAEKLNQVVSELRSMSYYKEEKVGDVWKNVWLDQMS